MPPAPDTSDGRGCGVAGDPGLDPARVGHDIVDAVGRRLAQRWQRKVVRPDRLGLAFGAQFTVSVFEVADQLVLLGVDGNGRLVRGMERLTLGFDVFELCVAIGVMGALAGLTVGLEAEA